MYSPELLDHFQNPRNVGELSPSAVVVEVTNPACGDVLRLSIEFENGGVVRAAYQARGCAPSIAAGSVLTELIIGKTTAQLKAVRAADIESLLGGLPPESRHAAVLATDALRAASDGRG